MNAAASGRADQDPPLRRVHWSMVALCGVYLLLILPRLSGPQASFAAAVIGSGVFGLLGLIFAVRAATSRFLPGSVRRFWWTFGVGLLLFNLTPVGMALSGTLGLGAESEVAFSRSLSLGDLFRLSAVVPMLAALLLVPRSNATRHDGGKLLLDIVAVAAGAFMLVWYFVLGPVVTSDLPPLAMLVAVAYPISDLTTVFGVVVVVLRGTHPVSRRPMMILLLGLLLSAASDTFVGYRKIHPGANDYPTLQLAAVMTELFLIAAAGLEQCLSTDVDAARPGTRLSTAGNRLPYFALAAGFVLLLAASWRSDLYPWFGLVAGGVVMTCSVAVRHNIAMRENHALAISDNLTGLSNRRRLHECLTGAVERSNRTGKRTAVLMIDLNDFKQINDALGHDAGDQLLIAVAGLLRASVLGTDTVARFGGDEFAIVLHDVASPESASAVAERIITRMQEPIAINGELVCPAGSIGMSVTEPGHPCLPAELLRQADVAMYRAKTQRASTYHLHQEDRSNRHATAQHRPAPQQSVSYPP